MDCRDSSWLIPYGNFEWKERYINGIKENGIECWWCIGLCKENKLNRFYKIVPFYNQDESGIVISNVYKYFVLFESCEFTECENVLENSDMCYGKHILVLDTPIIVGIYESLESAQKRAIAQLEHIKGLIKTYFPIEKESNDN